MIDKLYPLYREAFRAVDTDHDGVILPKEYDQVQRFDVDQDRQVTLWEYLTTHNRRRASDGLGPLFSNQLIDRLKESYHMVFREQNEVIFPPLPDKAELFDLIDIVTKLKEIGASQNEVSDFIEKMSTIRPSPTYRYLLPLLESLQSLHLETRKIIGFLSILVEWIWYGPGIDEAHKSLPGVIEFLKKQDLTGNEIIDFLTKIVEEGGVTGIGTTFGMIPSVAQIFCDEGMPIKETLGLLEAISQWTQWRTAELFTALPKIVSELKSLGRWDKNGPKRILEIVSKTERAAADALSLYPRLLEAGFTDAEFDRLTQRVLALGVVESWVVLRNMKRALEPLKKKGHTKKEMGEFFEKSLSAFGLVTSELYSKLGIYLDAGFTLSEVLSFPYEIARNAGLPPENVHRTIVTPKTVLNTVCTEMPATIQAMKSAGFTTNEIKALLRNVTRLSGRIEWGSSNLFEKIASAASLLKNYQIPTSDIAEFLEGIAKRSGETSTLTYSVLVDLLIRHDEQGGRKFKDEFSDFRTGFYIMTDRVGGNDLPGLKNILKRGNLKLNPAEIKDRKGLADRIAATINQRFDQFQMEKASQEEGIGSWENEAQWLAVLINHIHDRDQKDDLMRKTIVQGLSMKAVYLLSSVAGPDLYTSTFVDRIYAMKIQNDPNFFPEVKRIDPQGNFMAGFIITLAGFNRLKEVFQRDPEYFSLRVVKLLEESRTSSLLRNISLLSKVIGQFLAGEAGSEVKRQIEKVLFERYEALGLPEDVEKRAAIGYLIKLYHSDFSERARAETIAKNLPEILPPKIPSEWMADGRLKAVLKFYPDEKHFTLIQEMYAKKGFQIRRSASGKTVTMTKQALRPDGRKVAFEVVATLEEIDIDKLMADRSVDIIGHRGHSFHLGETLPNTDAAKNRKKLIFIGSCGGFREVPSLMGSYGGNYFISDEDTGHGSDNNNILYSLMEAIGSGAKSWEQIRTQVASQYSLESRGLVFPNDRSLLLFDFIKAVRAKRNQR